MWQVIERGGAVRLLERSLKTGRLPNAYLLVGPAHVGKMTMAMDLARALNCTGLEPPCGECTSCRKIAAGKHADIQTIDLTSNLVKEKPRTEISIEQVREIQHAASFPPFEGRYRVFIINGAESLSNQAANCLLKTLEEPVGNTLFLLLTLNDLLLPATVVSRCQLLEMPPLPAGKVEEALQKGWQIEPEQARLLSRLSRGCLGWAVTASREDSILEQRSERMEKMLAVIKGNLDDRFVYAAELAAEFSRNRSIIQETIDLWLDWWHDVLLVKSGCPEAITNTDFEAVLNSTVKVYNLSEICSIIDHIRAAMTQVRLNASPRLVLEVVMLSIPRRMND